jgi:hypothetical protein
MMKFEGVSFHLSNPLHFFPSLKVAARAPSQSDALLARVAGRRWQWKGAGLRSVYSRLNKFRVSVFQLRAGLRRPAGSMAWDPSGRVRCLLALLLLLLLFAVLQRKEPDVVGIEAMGGSINKAGFLAARLGGEVGVLELLEARSAAGER